MHRRTFILFTMMLIFTSFGTIMLSWKSRPSNWIFPESSITKNNRINYTERILQVREVCQTRPEFKKRIQVKAIQFRDILVDDKHKFLYCSIPKVGSSTWKKILLILSGENIDVNMTADNIYNLESDYRKKLKSMSLSNYSPAGIKYRIKNYLKFIVVRDPLERLLSAYRNKFNEQNSFFPTKFGRQIISLYRKNPSPHDLKTGLNVTFPEFIQFVVDPLTSAEQKTNEHWTSYNDLCLPCVVKYNVIGKYETLSEDASFILKQLEVDDKIKFPERSVNYQYPETSKFLDEAYKNVSSWQLNALWDTFYFDFKMFGYKIKQF